MDSVQKVIKNFETYSDKDFIIDAATGETFTYYDIFSKVNVYAARMQTMGLKTGDRIAIILPNSTEHAVFLFACLLSGITTVPINQTQKSSEVKVILEESKTSKIVCGEKDASRISEISNDLEIILFSSITSEQCGSLKSIELPLRGVNGESVMTIIFTSGTTGTPKGVIHTVHDLIGNADLFCNAVGVDSTNIFYNNLSMSYLGGYYNLLMLPFTMGSSVVIDSAFSPHSAMDFWPPIMKYKVNTLWLVPTIISIIMEFDRKEDGKNYARENIKLCLAGTAPLTSSVRNAFEDKYGVELLLNYGLSETLFISTQYGSVRSNSGVGAVLPGIQIKVVPMKDSTTENANEGEVYVKTPYLMNGYFNNEMELDEDGFFPTGDVGYFFDGELILSGRKKDLIIRSGLNISPISIENLLLSHDSVTKCAVVGIPHRINGEDIVAVVSLKDQVVLSDVRAELYAMCDENLSSAKRPSYFFQIDSFPMGSSGKIKKNVLKEIILSRISQSDFSLISRKKKEPKVLGALIKKVIPRPDKALVAQLHGIPTSIISDAINRLGSVSALIKPICKGRPFCGPAFTVEEVEGSNLMNHIALDMVKPGDVLVIAGKEVATRSCWGGLQTTRAKKVGISGVVIDGLVRDYDDIEESGLPVYARGISPAGPLKEPNGRINYPVAIGSVAVTPGDVVVGDNDGVVVVPLELVEEVIAVCFNKIKQEKEWFERVNDGDSALKTVGIDKILGNMNIEYR